MKENNGSWIFISHSSDDIEKVRIIRNEFERYGQNPLAFHLKCLNDNTTKGKKELYDLIEREIEARDWFVYCESESARESSYVQMEREYVQKCDKQFVWLINLDQSIDDIKKKVYEICCLLQIYIVYSRRDEFIVKPLKDALKENDFSVWDSQSIYSSDLIKNEMTALAKRGFVLFINTENTRNSSSVLAEIKAAYEQCVNIIVFDFDDIKLNDEFSHFVNSKNVYKIPTIPKDEDMYLLVDLVKAALKKKIKGAIQIQADAFNEMNKVQEKLNYDGNYHKEEPRLVKQLGATDDYLEIYEFPCCHKMVIVGDGSISRFRYDGCIKNKKE